MYRLYDYLPSGNGYKVRLALARLGMPYDRVEVDILKGETRTAEFLAKNPNGRIPVLELEDGGHLAESNAILWFLADGTPMVPDSRLARAQVLQWMFFEQYSHEPYLAVARFWLSILRVGEERREELQARQKGARAALVVMEGHLQDAAYFVGGRYSIADILLYAYTHVAPEAGVELEPFPAVRAWLARVAGQPGHVPITRA